MVANNGLLTMIAPYVPHYVVRPLIALVIIGGLAPFADTPADYLRAVEIGLSAVCVHALVHWGVLFQRRYQAMGPTAATPYIVWMVVISNIVWILGATTAVVGFFAADNMGFGPVVFFGILGQPLTLAWVLPFIAKLEAEERASE